MFVCVLCCGVVCLQASQGDITGDARVYLDSEKRSLSASVTLHVRIHTWIPICTDTHVHAQRGSFELAGAPPPPRGPVEGHAFVSRCQDAGVCSCASRSVRFISFSRGCPFVCGPVSFHPTPVSLPPPTNAPEDSSGSVVFQTLWHCLFQQHNPAFPRYPRHPPPPVRRVADSLKNVIRPFYEATKLPRIHRCLLLILVARRNPLPGACARSRHLFPSHRTPWR